MKAIRSFSLVKILVLVLATVAGVSTLAHAQSSARGKFTLPSETHWGIAVLPAGDYTFSLDSSSVPSRVTIRTMSGAPVAIVVPTCTSPSTSGGSRLSLTFRGGEAFVSSLYLKDLGMELSYLVPKESKLVLAQQTTKMKPLTVATSAK